MIAILQCCIYSEMGVVTGVILDESVLLAEGDGYKSVSSLQPGVESLIKTLLQSRIHIGIAYNVELQDDKVSILKRIASLHSLHCFILNDHVSEVVMPVWGDNESGNIIYLVSSKKELLLLPELRTYNWLIVGLNVGGESEGSHEYDTSNIENLEELPLKICRLNKKFTGNKFLTVGYIMKPSRVEDFAKRGAFPLCPTQNGLMFVPLLAKLPLSSQLKDVDVVLHKATDEILSIEDNRPTFTQNM